DDFGDNREAIERFFDPQGALRSSEIARLASDVNALLLPSPARALELDRAGLATAASQSYEEGREPVLAPSANAYDIAPIGAKTGIARPVVAVRLARAAR